MGRTVQVRDGWQEVLVLQVVLSAVLLMWRNKKAEPVADNTRKESLETAWKIHGAIVDWTGKVDAKASFAFTIESAGVATTIALSGDKRMFNILQGPWQNVLYYGGIVALLIAAAFSVWVVIPRLRMRHVKGEYPENFIYFGHLQYWNPEDLPAAIGKRDLLPVLSHQMVKMSQIAWRKHVAVKISMWLAISGGVGLVVCGTMIRFGLTP